MLLETRKLSDRGGVSQRRDCRLTVRLGGLLVVALFMSVFFLTDVLLGVSHV